MKTINVISGNKINQMLSSHSESSLSISGHTKII